MTAPVTGAIMAGGLARRMGGGDKTLRLVAGRPILSHVIARLRPQCGALILNANGDPERFAPYGLDVVPDGVPGFAGPLAGILAALDAAAELHPGVQDVVSVSADTPFLPRDLVARLAAGREAAGAVVACAVSGGRTHPVVALWPVTLREPLRHALTVEQEHGVGRFAARYPLARVEWPTDPVDPFFNANTPDDLAAADAMAADVMAGSLRD